MSDAGTPEKPADGQQRPQRNENDMTDQPHTYQPNGEDCPRCSQLNLPYPFICQCPQDQTIPDDDAARAAEARRYGQQVNAPLSARTIAALRDRLASGDVPVHLVPTPGRTAPDNPPASGDAADNPGAQIAYRIRAELVCCRIYDRINDTHELTIRQAKDNRDWHDLCYWGEASARIAEGRCPGYDTEPNICRCKCEGCRHNCAAHQPTPAEREQRR